MLWLPQRWMSAAVMGAALAALGVPTLAGAQVIRAGLEIPAEPPVADRAVVRCDRSGTGRACWSQDDGTAQSL